MKELIKTQKVYLVNTAHEFAVAKMIPAKYIEVGKGLINRQQDEG